MRTLINLIFTPNHDYSYILCFLGIERVDLGTYPIE